MSFNHVHACKFSNRTSVQLESAVEKLGVINVLYLKRAGYHASNKDVFQLEESFVQCSLIEWFDDIVSQDISWPRVEIGVHGWLELGWRDVILGSDITDGFPFLC